MSSTSLTGSMARYSNITSERAMAPARPPHSIARTSCTQATSERPTVRAFSPRLLRVSGAAADAISPLCSWATDQSRPGYRTSLSDGRACSTLCPPQPPETAAQAFRAAVGGLASVRTTKGLDHAVSVKALASVMTGCPLIYVGEGNFADMVSTYEFGVALPPQPSVVGEAMRQLATRPWSPEERRALSGRAAVRFDNRPLGAIAAASIAGLLGDDVC